MERIAGRGNDSTLVTFPLKVVNETLFSSGESGNTPSDDVKLSVDFHFYTVRFIRFAEKTVITL